MTNRIEEDSCEDLPGCFLSIRLRRVMVDLITSEIDAYSAEI